MNGPHDAMQPTVAAIVLSYNDREAVVRCVSSLRASTYPRLSILVVDNASADGTPGEVARTFPDVTLLVNARNLGFGAGCNVGIAAALRDGADFVLLINQDTTVAPDMVSQLVAAAAAHPEAAVFGPKTLSTRPGAGGAPRLLYAGAFRGRLPLSQRLPGIEQEDDGRFDTAQVVDYVWGHGMLLRTTALRQVGAFDDAYFMYYEDLDLCRRIAAAGHAVRYEPSAVMWHDIADGARGVASDAWRWRCKVESIATFHRKYHGRAAAAALTALTIAQEARMLLRTGRTTAVRQLFAAYLRALFGGARTEGPPARPLAAK